MKAVVVVGAGGHGKVVVATARAAGWDVTAVVDDDQRLWGTTILGVRVSGPAEPVLGDTNQLAVLAVGSNAARAHMHRVARCSFPVVLHPGSIVHDSAKLGSGTVVFAGAVIQPDVVIGVHGIVNTGASIDHDCHLGNCVHVAPGARLAGTVSLGDEVFVGIGAVLVPGIAVGSRTRVGAGAAVVEDIPADVIAVGVPARVRRRQD